MPALSPQFNERNEMRKGIFALESMEDSTPVADGELESSIADIDKADGEIESTSSDIDEMTDVQETVAAMSDKAEASLASAVEAPGEGVKDTRSDEDKADGDGLSEETAEVLEVAVEHFRKQLGYRKKIMPAMEGFADVKTRRQATKLAMENLNELHDRLQGKIEIAQEGLVESISKSIGMMFETEAKVLTKLNAVSLAYDTAGMRDGTIANPTWGKYLSGGSQKFTGSNAVAHMTAISKAVNDQALVSDVSELSKCMKALTKEVRGNWFVSNKNDIDRIEKIHGTITQLGEALQKDLSLASKSKAEEYAPVSAKEKESLVSLVKSTLGDKALQKTIEEFTSGAASHTFWATLQAQFRIKGLLAEDLVKVRKAASEATAVVKVINSIISSRVKVASAVVSYIEASTK